MKQILISISASAAMLAPLVLAGEALAQNGFPTDEQVREAQTLAVDLDQTLLPDETHTRELLFDLQAIRCAFPEIAHIRFLPIAVPDEVIVGLTQEALERLQNGEFTELDELNADLGAVSIRQTVFGSLIWILIKFDRIYNTELLAALYAPLPGVRYAAPNHYIGDGSNVSADPPIYIFIERWGDCPSGCLYEEAFTFEVNGADVIAIDNLPLPTGAEPDPTCENYRCGNGELDATEQCDDGNTLDGDDCSLVCTIESPPLAVPTLPPLALLALASCLLGAGLYLSRQRAFG